MALASGNYFYPRIGQARPYDGIVGQAPELEEISYDPASMTYKTRSQQIEINRLEQELALKNQKKKADLKNIIGYYYKRK